MLIHLFVYPLWIVKKPIVPSMLRVYSRNQKQEPLSLKKAKVENHDTVSWFLRYVEKIWRGAEVALTLLRFLLLVDERLFEPLLVL